MKVILFARQTRWCVEGDSAGYRDVFAFRVSDTVRRESLRCSRPAYFVAVCRKRLQP